MLSTQAHDNLQLLRFCELVANLYECVCFCADWKFGRIDTFRSVFL